jgi:hypothetical protein
MNSPSSGWMADIFAGQMNVTASGGRFFQDYFLLVPFDDVVYGRKGSLTYFEG